MWAHRRRQKENERLTCVSWWACLRATMAILLGRYVEDYRSLGWDEWTEVAWGDDFRYGEYGCGRGWITCAVKGLKYTIYDDGDY